MIKPRYHILYLTLLFCNKCNSVLDRSGWTADEEVGGGYTLVGGILHKTYWKFPFSTRMGHVPIPEQRFPGRRLHVTKVCLGVWAGLGSKARWETVRPFYSNNLDYRSAAEILSKSQYDAFQLGDISQSTFFLLPLPAQIFAIKSRNPRYLSKWGDLRSKPVPRLL